MATGEKRVAPRNRVLKSAKIVSKDNKTVIDCAIRNQSKTGAQVVIAQAIAVPEEFQFYLASDDTVRDAVAVWRRGERVGVEFTGESRPAPAGIKLHRR